MARSLSSIVFLAAFAFVSVVSQEVDIPGRKEMEDKGWSFDQEMPRSEYYIDIHVDEVKTKVFSKEYDSILHLYGQRCSVCIQNFPNQEKGGKLILGRLERNGAQKELKLWRIDVNRFDSLETFQKRFPEFKTTAKERGIPQMFYVKRGGFTKSNRAKVQEITHHTIGYNGHDCLVKELIKGTYVTFDKKALMGVKERKEAIHEEKIKNQDEEEPEMPAEEEEENTEEEAESNTKEEL